MSARFVGVKARTWTHAVWVPHDLPVDPPVYETVERSDRTPLVRAPRRWVGRAECGQLVKGVVAGARHGHDWDTFSENVKCPRCVRRIEGSVR